MSTPGTPTTTTTTTTTTMRTHTRSSSSISGSPTGPKPLLLASSATVSPDSAGPSTGSSTSTLRSLYPRAARALLQRDFDLAHTLIESAFVFLTEPATATQDALDVHRRKWDLLRITLETSAFVSPPSSPIAGPLPSTLRANLTMTPQNLVAEMHMRSVRLFTPQRINPSAAYLPAQILVALIFSSVKLHCPEKGRSIIEDWLAQRPHSPEERDYDADGYVRVVELFCLQVLPRLHDWEYAEEFLEYERELPPATRQNFIVSLKALRKREIEAARTIPSPGIPDPQSEGKGLAELQLPPRAISPTLSIGSASSTDTDDTHSTRTIVPNSSRMKGGLHGLKRFTPTPTSSSSSLTELGNGRLRSPRKRPSSPASTVRASASLLHTPIPRHGALDANTLGPQHALSTRQSSSVMAFIKTSLRPVLSSFSTSQIVIGILFMLVPLFSFVMRLRRRRQSAFVRSPGSISSSGAGVEDVRRRLARRTESRSGVLGTVWQESVRAIFDAVRMAGSGLV